jgi:hypothetical protein
VLQRLQRFHQPSARPACCIKIEGQIVHSSEAAISESGPLHFPDELPGQVLSSFIFAPTSCKNENVPTFREILG